MKKALSQALVEYYPTAGRLRRCERGRFQVECNGIGGEFTEAESDVRIDDLGDFKPGPALFQLVPPGRLPRPGPQPLRHRRHGCVSVRVVVSGARARGPGGVRPSVPGQDAPAHGTTTGNVIQAPGVRSPAAHAGQPRLQRGDEQRDGGGGAEVRKRAGGKDKASGRRVHPVPGPGGTHMASGFDEQQGEAAAAAAGGLLRERNVHVDGGGAVRGPGVEAAELRGGRVSEAVERMSSDAYLRSALHFLAGVEDLKQYRRGGHTVGCDEHAAFHGCPNLLITGWLGLPMYRADFRWGPPLIMLPPSVGFEGKAFLFPSPDGGGGVLLALRLVADHMKLFKDMVYEGL
ncbi:hypothetical protein ACLOJK_002673 [Asimina triloba]